MGMPDYTCLIKEMFIRTITNNTILEHVQKGEQTNEKPYEVTMLINSLMSLLIIPSEKYRIDYGKNLNTDLEKQIKDHSPKEYEGLKTKIEDLESKNRLRVTDDNAWKNYPITQFISHLRNAAAHSGNKMLIFHNNASLEIDGIYFADKNNKQRYFCTLIMIDELKEILSIINEIFINLETDSIKEERISNKFISRKKEFDIFLKNGTLFN